MFHGRPDRRPCRQAQELRETNDPRRIRRQSEWWSVGLQGQHGYVDANSGILVVVRPPTQMRDRLRAYRIEVDGVSRGEMRPASMLRIELGPGTHRVRARIDWTGSPPMEVRIARGSTVQLRVEPAGNVLQTFTQAFGRDRYLRLTEDGYST
jgi:hypothetical protein